MRKYLATLTLLSIILSGCSKKAAEKITVKNMSEIKINEIQIIPPNHEPIIFNNIAPRSSIQRFDSIQNHQPIIIKTFLPDGKIIESKSPASDTDQTSYEFQIHEDGSVFTIGKIEE